MTIYRKGDDQWPLHKRLFEQMKEEGQLTNPSRRKAQGEQGALNVKYDKRDARTLKPGEIGPVSGDDLATKMGN